MENPLVVLAVAVPGMVWSVIQVLHFWPDIPERIPSHFNFHGEPDAWVSKRFFVGLYLILIIIFGGGAIFLFPQWLAATYLMPAFFHFAFTFNRRPERKWLSMLLWVLLPMTIVAVAFTLFHLW